MEIRRIYGKTAETLNDEEWSEVAYNLGRSAEYRRVLRAGCDRAWGCGVAVGGGEKLLDQARVVMEANLRLVPAPKVQLCRLGYDNRVEGGVGGRVPRIE
jgi:hypothetical protein